MGKGAFPTRSWLLILLRDGLQPVVERTHSPRSPGGAPFSGYRAWVTWQTSSDAIQEFIAARDWAQFHSPENLAKSIAIEAAELVECYQWSPDALEQDVRRELADVLIYCLLLAARLDVDVDEVISAKLKENTLKYPVERSRGRAMKYDRL